MSVFWQSMFKKILGWVDPLDVITAHVHWVAGGISPNNLPIFTADIPVTITSIIGRVEVPSVKPARLTLVKVVNGEAMTTGAVLSPTVFDAAGLPNSNQVLELTENTSVLDLDVGDSIGVQTSGVWVLAAGGITVHMMPAV